MQKPQKQTKTETGYGLSWKLSWTFLSLETIFINRGGNKEVGRLPCGKVTVGKASQFPGS